MEQNRPRLFTYLLADLFLYMTSGPVTITRTFYYNSGMFNLGGNKVTVLSICLQIWCSLSFNHVIHHNLVLMALRIASKTHASLKPLEDMYLHKLNFTAACTCQKYDIRVVLSCSQEHSVIMFCFLVNLAPLHSPQICVFKTIHTRVV